MEMISAGRVEDDPIGGIRRNDRREALQPPKSAKRSSSIILDRIRIADDQVGYQNLRLGGGHADKDASGLGKPIPSIFDSPLSLG